MSKTDAVKQYTFSSSLRFLIDDFIKEKRSIGYLYNTESKKLANFDKYLVSKQYDYAGLTREIVEEYTAKTSYETVSNHIARHRLICQFGKYLQRIGVDAYVSSIIFYEINTTDFVPYIFSDSEIKSIIDIADNYPQSPKSPRRHLVLPMLLRILYGCGLRISEALNLKVKDVDCINGIFNIQGGKFDKDRLVPMSVSLCRYTKHYMTKMNLGSLPEIPFLPSPRGTHYAPHSIHPPFRGILFRAKIPYGGKRKGPRVHDFRHTFAVHCLKNWTKRGIDINAALPYLSSYLGHKGLKGTQRYLRLTADMFPHITMLMENTYGNIIQGGGASDENS